MNAEPRVVSHEEIQKTGEFVIERVAPHRAIQMILELAMYPREDVMYRVIDEAKQLYAMSYR